MNAHATMRNRQNSVILHSGSSTITIGEPPRGANIEMTPRRDGLLAIPSSANVDERRDTDRATPIALLQKLRCICNDCLPEESGLND